MPKIAQVRKLFFNDEEIGMGFNSSTGLAIGKPFKDFTTRGNPVASGMRVRSSVSIVTTHEDLQESLDMAFEAQGRYGIASAAAKVQFSEQTNYNSESTFVVARVVVENALIRGDGFHLTEDANTSCKQITLPPSSRPLATASSVACIPVVSSMQSFGLLQFQRASRAIWPQRFMLK